MGSIIIGLENPLFSNLIHIFTTLLAVAISIIIALRQIENRFKIEEKKHDIFRARKLWDLRFQVFKELGELIGKYVEYSEESTYKIATLVLINKIHDLQWRSRALFEGEQIYQALKDLKKLVIKANKDPKFLKKNFSPLFQVDVGEIVLDIKAILQFESTISQS